MYQPTPEFPPLYAPGKWWQLRLECLIESGNDSEAIRFANSHSGIRNRDWMRFEIRDRQEKSTMLSLPVKGGASALKNRPPVSWTLSSECMTAVTKIDHTVSTLLGNKPYFPFIFPLLSLKTAFCNIQTGNTYDLCCFIDKETKKVLGLNDMQLVETVRQKIEEGPEALRYKCSSLRRNFDSEVSFLESIMRYGPEAIFALIPPF